MDDIKVPAPTNKDTQAYRIASTLMQLLNDGSVPNALWWLDDDTFAADPKYFQTQVLDPYFRGTKYASFLRTMHKMGFARLSRRFDLPKGVVAYSCELFRKEKPELMHKIRMCNSGKQAQALKEALTKSKTQSKADDKKEKSSEESFKPKKGAKSSSSPKKTAKPDPPSVNDTKTKAGGAASPKAASTGFVGTSGAGNRNSAMERLLAVQAQSNARIAMLRGQTAAMGLGFDAQRLLLQQQQMQQHQERLMRGPFPMHHQAVPNNFLELALIEQALSKRLTGPR